jgi:hypothetical protein
MRKILFLIFFTLIFIGTTSATITMPYYSGNQTYVLYSNGVAEYTVQKVSSSSGITTFDETINVTAINTFPISNNLPWYYNLYNGKNNISTINVTGVPGSYVGGNHYLISVHATKIAEVGDSSILLYPRFDNFALDNFTWWNTSYSYMSHSSNGVLPLINLINTSGTNTNNTLYSNGTFLSNFDSIQFVKNNVTTVPFYLITNGTNQAIAYVNQSGITSTDDIEIYWSNTTDLGSFSNNATTFAWSDTFHEAALSSGTYSTIPTYTIGADSVLSMTGGTLTSTAKYSQNTSLFVYGSIPQSNNNVLGLYNSSATNWTRYIWQSDVPSYKADNVKSGAEIVANLGNQFSGNHTWQIDLNSTFSSTWRIDGVKLLDQSSDYPYSNMPIEIGWTGGTFQFKFLGIMNYNYPTLSGSNWSSVTTTNLLIESTSVITTWNTLNMDWINSSTTWIINYNEDGTYVNWLINGSSVQLNSSGGGSVSYTNSTPGNGVWNVTAIANSSFNTPGIYANQSWIWIVNNGTSSIVSKPAEITYVCTE